MTISVLRALCLLLAAPGLMLRMPYAKSHSHSGQILTDQSMLCYNFIHGAGTALGWCLPAAQCGRRFNLVSMVSINLRIWLYGVEMGDAGETIEHEESQ